MVWLVRIMSATRSRRLNLSRQRNEGHVNNGSERLAEHIDGVYRKRCCEKDCVRGNTRPSPITSHFDPLLH